MREGLIYLDYAATAPADESVIAAMAECMRSVPFNASAAYAAAGEARRIHRLCRCQLGDMLACPAENICFTSGGTEGNKWVMHAFRGQHAVVSAIEHHSILEPARAHGCASFVLPDPDGYIRPEAVEAAIRPDTRLICLQAANNETGVIQPVKEVYAIAKARGIHVHVDAVQAFGHIPLQADCCDSMTVTAHKLCGPRGVGALYMRRPIPPYMLGGGQEFGLRAGTENTPGICGFHKALLLAQEDMIRRMEREEKLLAAWVERMKASIPGLVLLGENRRRLPGIASVLIPGLEAEAAIAALDLKGILVSGGAACAARSGRPSHVYTAMGLGKKEAAQVLRISIGRKTTADELNEAARAIEDLFFCK